MTPPLGRLELWIPEFPYGDFLFLLPNLLYLITCDYATESIIKVLQGGFVKIAVSRINTIGDHDGVIPIMMPLETGT